MQVALMIKNSEAALSELELTSIDDNVKPPAELALNLPNVKKFSFKGVMLSKDNVAALQVIKTAAPSMQELNLDTFETSEGINVNLVNLRKLTCSNTSPFMVTTLIKSSQRSLEELTLKSVTMAAQHLQFFNLVNLKKFTGDDIKIDVSISILNSSSEKLKELELRNLKGNSNAFYCRDKFCLEKFQAFNVPATVVQAILRANQSQLKELVLSNVTADSKRIDSAFLNLMIQFKDENPNCIVKMI